MAKRVKREKRAAFHRDMYPGVAFCEGCFCHHNAPDCPDWRALNPAINNPICPDWVNVDQFGTWRKVEPDEAREAA